jgi:hypothetical protein
MMFMEMNRYLGKECNLIQGFMLKRLSSLSSLLSSSVFRFASVSLASTALVTAPYLMADSRFGTANSSENSKAAQCHALFENVVDARHVGEGFYSRKAVSIRSLHLSDGKLQSLQARFSQVFTHLESAQRNGDGNATNRLGRQAAQLVGDLNRQCFQ